MRRRRPIVYVGSINRRTRSCWGVNERISRIFRFIFQARRAPKARAHASSNSSVQCRVRKRETARLAGLCASRARTVIFRGEYDADVVEMTGKNTVTGSVAIANRRVSHCFSRLDAKHAGASSDPICISERVGKLNYRNHKLYLETYGRSVCARIYLIIVLRHHDPVRLCAPGIVPEDKVLASLEKIRRQDGHRYRAV